MGTSDQDGAADGAASPPVAENLQHRVERRLFDDSSPHLDRFGTLLLLTIASVVALSLIDLNDISDERVRTLVSLVLSLTTGVTLVLALRAAGVVRRWRRLAELLVVVAAVLTVVALLALVASDADSAALRDDRPSIVWVAIAIATPAAVIRRLLQHRRVTVQTLTGAIAAYLLIALASCYLFLTIDAYVDGGFFGTGDDAASHEFMYFSLVTITTLGYGDLSPAEPVARLAATSEAVIGQVYLVTFVAMIVGLLIQQRNDR